MTRRPLKGLLALVPLVLNKNQEIDYEGIKANINFLEEAGFDGFVALSTMGQHYGIGEEEFNKFCDACVDAAQQSVCVIGTTWINTDECLRRTQYAEDAGADAALIAPPYMLLLVPEGVVEHYQMINDAIKGDMPLMVYNDPYLARQNIGIPIWQKLLKMENVKGLYDENYQLTHTQQLLPAIADKISVFEHETQFYFDTATFPDLNFSMVTVYGLAAPKAILEYYGACRTGNRQRALKLQKLIVEGYRIVPHRSSKIQPASVPARTNIPAFLMHQAAFLNAIAEIGGNNAGPQRTPYQPLPQKYHSELAQLIQRLNDSI